LKLPRRQEYLDLPTIEGQHLSTLATALIQQVPDLQLEGLPTLLEFHERDGILHARFDLSTLETIALEDSHHHPIIHPHERVLTKRHETDNESLLTSNDSQPAPRQPHPGSPIHAWRQLGLIDPIGTPTRRGEIFSFFQGGEGLAVVAALEDESYPIDELVLHLANLRAGIKLDLPSTTATASERLGAACRAAYGFINHHGYLENGLPLDYGDGAAEVLDAMLHPDRPGASDLRRGIQEGDLSRAYIEWLSQLRHIHHAPGHPWPRWTALQQVAQDTLKKHSTTLRHLFHLDLPPLTNRQKTTRTRHHLLPH
jgi:hypothetical protein